MNRCMKNTQDRNQTEVTEFILLGLTENPDLQDILFGFFLSIYMATKVDNWGMIMFIKIDSCLHTHRYNFLSSLTFVDPFYSSSVTPKILVNILSHNKAISFNGCAAHLYFFGSFLGTKCFLLAMKTYDHYAAIWNPLLTQFSCLENLHFFVVTSYLLGFGNAAIHKGMILRLSFCGSNRINHFNCDNPPLLKLSCSHTHISDIVIMAFSSFNVISYAMVVLVSYFCNHITILRMPSLKGREEAFSTCVSHLMDVIIFFGTILFMYLHPTSSYSVEQDKVVSVFYAVVIPTLNPFIYILKNKDVKEALKKSYRNT